MAVIAIIGAGNGAHALAADCKLGGAEVRMFEFSQFNNKVRGILNSRRIRFEGIEMNYRGFKRSGTAVIDMVTYDMAEAVHGADHILVSVQAQGFELVFDQLAPLLEDGQTVSIFPDNYGSLILRRILREKGLQTDVVIAGFSSLVYGARLIEFNNLETETDVVNVMYRENEIRVDTLPSCDYPRYLAAAAEIPALDATTLIHADTVLDTALSNLNHLIHVPAVLLNVGAIENWGIISPVGAADVYYDIYAYGASPGVGRLQYAFYRDMAAVAAAYGVDILPLEPDVLQSRMGPIGEMFYGEGYRQPFSQPLDQQTWLPAPKGARFPLDSRYLTEDVPVGCCGAMSFGAVLGVDTPILRAMTDITDIVLGKDYRHTGFSLSTFGLQGSSAGQILTYLRTGAAAL